MRIECPVLRPFLENIIFLTRFQHLPNCSAITELQILRCTPQIQFLSDSPNSISLACHTVSAECIYIFYFNTHYSLDIFYEISNGTWQFNKIPFNSRLTISDTNILIFLLIIRSRFERCWQGPNKASNGRPHKFLPESDPHLEIPTHLGFTPPCHDIFTPLFDFLWAKDLGYVQVQS